MYQNSNPNLVGRFDDWWKRDNKVLGAHPASNPPESDYGMVLQEIELLNEPSENV